VIIGGGLAGMAAADAIIRQCPHRCEVTLVESRRQTGGRAGSFTDPESGDAIDYCQHVAMGCCTNFLGLIDRCGLTSAFRRHQQLRFFHPDHPPSCFAPARFLPPPLHLAGALGGLNYLNRGQQAQIRRGLWRLMRTGTDALRNTTAANWLAENGQAPATIAAFWDVILVSALGEETGVVTMAAARKVLIDGFAAARGAADILIPREPLAVLFGQRLPDALRKLGVRLLVGDGVKQVSDNDDGVSVELTSGEQLTADHLISAVPWNRVGTLLGQTAAAAAIAHFDDLQRFPTSPITGLHLWFDREITSQAHAVMVGTISQWLFRDPIDSPRDSVEHYYQVVISASHQARQLPREELVDRVLVELRHAFPEARAATLLRHRIVTDPRAVFSIRPEVDAMRPPARTPLPWLHLAGDWIATGWPATMEGAVISGRMAAASVLDREGITPVDIDPGLPPSWLARWLIKP
jgi:squalene-associated FAD-dependent desaturase